MSASKFWKTPGEEDDESNESSSSTDTQTEKQMEGMDEPEHINIDTRTLHGKNSNKMVETVKSSCQYL
jgi:hypothetical protein